MAHPDNSNEKSISSEAFSYFDKSQPNHLAALTYNFDGVYCRQVSNDLKKITFESVSRETLTDEVLKRIQTALGYDPAGYGSPMGITSERYKNFHVTRWRIWASCD